MASPQFNNALLSITSETTPDPFVSYENGRFYLTFTAGDRIEIWSAASLTDFSDNSRCAKHVVWSAPPFTPHSNDLWAPELHNLNGRWYIYYAAANALHGNKSHRMYVLGGPPSSQDPTSAGWEHLGVIRGMHDHWAIDGTVITLNGTLYFIYSGWPLGDTSMSDLIQELFIVRLSDPVTASSDSIRISTPELPFEWTENHGINEGPQVLESPDGSWIGIVYSCAGSWTSQYKENTLRYTGGDPLSPSSWTKSKTPLIQNNSHGKGPFGPGHGCFLHLGDETLHVFHATDGEHDGWNNRKARAQRVVFTSNGPEMGGVVGPVAANIEQFRAGVQGSQHSTGTGGVKGFFKKIRDEL